MSRFVFLVDGYGWSGGLPFMKIVQELGGTQVQFKYRNDLANNLVGMKDGVLKLDKVLNDPKYQGHERVVVGISMGAQLVYKWLRDYGDISSIPKEELSFVLLGNPENEVGGVAWFEPKTYGGGYDGCGVNVRKTRYKVINFTRQYDGVADYPNKPDPSWIAVANAVSGMALVHMFYFWVSLNDKNLLSHHRGNIEYVLSPTPTSFPSVEHSYDRSMYRPRNILESK